MANDDDNDDGNGPTEGTDMAQLDLQTLLGEPDRSRCRRLIEATAPR